MNVVNFGESRDLLKSWEQVKGLIANGRSFAVCIEGQDGEEHVIIAGDYRIDRKTALRASMRMSWELTRADEETAPAARIV